MEGQKEIDVQGVRDLLQEFDGHRDGRLNGGAVNLFRYNLRIKLGLPRTEDSLNPVLETLKAAGAEDLIPRVEAVLESVWN